MGETGCGICNDSDCLLRKCSYCHQRFCPDHRQPEHHNCHSIPDSEETWFGRGVPSTDEQIDWDIQDGEELGVPDESAGESYCRGCHTHVAELQTCNQCEGRYCQDCIPVTEHDCLALGNTEPSSEEPDEKVSGQMFISPTTPDGEKLAGEGTISQIISVRILLMLLFAAGGIVAIVVLGFGQL